MRRTLVSLAATVIVAACQVAETPKSEQASVQQQAVVAGAGQPDSARAWVQRFYDWYLTTKYLDGYDSLLTSRRNMLGDSLFRAFQADVAAQHADTIAEINSVSAESDIFLNSQDSCEHYATQGVSAAGPGVFAVTVAGDCGQDRRPHIEVYVRQLGNGWQIANIKDPTNPSYDLVKTLVRYHLSDPAVPDSVGADWLTYQGDGFTVRYPKGATLVRAESYPSKMPGIAIEGPMIHVPVMTDEQPDDRTVGPAYWLHLASFPNPGGLSAEQWVDSLRRAASRKSTDADTLDHSPPPSTGVLGGVRVLGVQPFCDECAAEELYIATPHRMIVASYNFDVGTRGFHEAQEHFYRALVSTLRPTD
jgi:hypothetical protein